MGNWCDDVADRDFNGFQEEAKKDVDFFVIILFMEVGPNHFHECNNIKYEQQLKGNEIPNLHNAIHEERSQVTKVLEDSGKWKQLDSRGYDYHDVYEYHRPIDVDFVVLDIGNKHDLWLKASHGDLDSCRNNIEHVHDIHLLKVILLKTVQSLILFDLNRHKVS